MPQIDINNQIEAWNNLAAVFKFMSLEEYLRPATLKDLVASLNTLAPQHQDGEEVQPPLNTHIEEAGFLPETEVYVKEVAEKLFNEISNNKETPLMDVIKTVLRNHIKRIKHD